MIELFNVCFAYGNKTILHNVDLKLQKGNFYSIIGPNGSGKTTLLNIMTGILKPVSGEVMFNNKPLFKSDFLEFCKRAAVISQDIHFRFPFTCGEIVLMGRTPFNRSFERYKKIDYEIAYGCMEETRTLQFWDTSIMEISGGERQRVILAKALAQTPEVLFLDEAFSSMDISRFIELLSILKKRVINDKLTIVSIMHDLNMAFSFSDRVVAMKEGNIVMYGDTQKVMKPELLNDLFKVKIEHIKDKGLLVNVN